MRTPVRAHAWSPVTPRGLALGLGLTAVGAVGPLVFGWAFGVLSAEACGPHGRHSPDACSADPARYFAGAVWSAGWTTVGAYLLGFAIVLAAVTLQAYRTGRHEDPETWWRTLGRTLWVWIAGGAVFLAVVLSGLVGGPAAGRSLFWTLAGLGAVVLLALPTRRRRAVLAGAVLLAGAAVPLVHRPTGVVDGWTALGAYAGWVLAVAVTASAYAPARPAPSVLRGVIAHPGTAAWSIMAG